MKKFLLAVVPVVVLQGASWQRCHVHFAGKCLGSCPFVRLVPTRFLEPGMKNAQRDRRELGNYSSMCSLASPALRGVGLLDRGDHELQNEGGQGGDSALPSSIVHIRSGDGGHADSTAANVPFALRKSARSSTRAIAPSNPNGAISTGGDAEPIPSEVNDARLAAPFSDRRPDPTGSTLVFLTERQSPRLQRVVRTG